VRGSLRLLLEVDDHIVTEANNGEEALDLFTKGQFDLVTTDFEMSVMKGNELEVRIKRLAPKQPILMITAYGKRAWRSHEPGGPHPEQALHAARPARSHRKAAVQRETPPIAAGKDILGK
jgi:CheY-like chemotaxis protein